MENNWKLHEHEETTSEILNSEVCQTYRFIAIDYKTHSFDDVGIIDLDGDSNRCVDELILEEVVDLPYVEITNLLSLYAESSIMNYLINNGLNMNFYLKSDSYSAALSIIKEGIGISILDDNTCARADNNLINISDILDTEFKYDVSAIIKKDIGSNQCNDFFNYLTEQI